MIWILAPIALVALWFIWRLTSVGRGAKKRDEEILKLIDPIGNKIDAGEEVTIDDVREIARIPQVRHFLFHALKGMEKESLIPKDYDSEELQAEAALAYWMMHPNELQTAPEKIEHFKTIEKSLKDSKGRFYFFKYLMPEGHWARNDGWLLGFSGPFYGDEKPYDELPSAFSRASDKAEEADPNSIIDWYLEMLETKGYET